MNNLLEFMKISLVAFSITVCAGIGAFAYESQQSNEDAALSGLEKNQYGEIFVPTGPDTKYSSSQITQTQHQLFCQSNILTINIDRRIDDSDEDTLIIFDISAQLNGEKVDFFRGQGEPEALNDYFVIDSDMTCIEEEWVVYLTGYSDSRTRSGSTLASLKIDAYSGKIK